MSRLNYSCRFFPKKEAQDHLSSLAALNVEESTGLAMLRREAGAAAAVRLGYAVVWCLSCIVAPLVLLLLPPILRRRPPSPAQVQQWKSHRIPVPARPCLRVHSHTNPDTALTLATHCKVPAPVRNPTTRGLACSQNTGAVVRSLHDPCKMEGVHT